MNHLLLNNDNLIVMKSRPAVYFCSTSLLLTSQPPDLYCLDSFLKKENKSLYE